MTSTAAGQAPTNPWSAATRRATRAAPVASSVAKPLLVALGVCMLFGGFVAQHVVWAWSVVAVVLALGCCGLVRYAAIEVPCLFDPRACWHWLRCQAPFEPQTALAQAGWKIYVFTLALVTWFMSVGIESDFEAARSRATSDQQLAHAIGNLLEAVATAMLFAMLTVPPVWIWRLVRRGQAQQTLAAEGVKLRHVIAGWVCLCLTVGLLVGLIVR